MREDQEIPRVITITAAGSTGGHRVLAKSFIPSQLRAHANSPSVTIAQLWVSLTARKVANLMTGPCPHQGPGIIAPGLAMIEPGVRLTDKIMI
jgi:hypothetical protein